MSLNIPKGENSNVLIYNLETKKDLLPYHDIYINIKYICLASGLALSLCEEIMCTISCVEISVRSVWKTKSLIFIDMNNTPDDGTIFQKSCSLTP